MATFRFRNELQQPLDVYVEPWPELFRLLPGELLEFEYSAPPDGGWMEIISHDEGVTVWADVPDEPRFLIDGKPANHRSWDI